MRPSGTGQRMAPAGERSTKVPELIADLCARPSSDRTVDAQRRAALPEAVQGQEAREQERAVSRSRQ